MSQAFRKQGRTPRVVHFDASLSPASMLQRELLGAPPAVGQYDPSWSPQAAEHYDSALRWLTVTDQKVSGELGRALVEMRDGWLYEQQGHARWSTYVRAFVGRTLRWTQYEMRRERALRDLPALAFAFESGGVNKSKLRVLLAVVTPETERLWLERSRFMSVRELEVAVGLDQAERGEAPAEDPDADADGEPRVVCHVVPAPPGVTVLVGEAVEVARKVAGYQVGAGAAVGMMAAEIIAGIPSDAAPPDARDSDAVTCGGPAGDGQAPGPARHAAVTDGSHTDLVAELGRTWAEQHRLMEEATCKWADLPWALSRIVFEEVPPAEAPAHRRVVFWVAAQGRLDAVRGRLLRIVDASMPARRLEFEGLGQYVRERLGMSLREARELIDLDVALSRLPAAFAMYAAGKLSRSAAWLVARVATTPRGDAMWTRAALTHSLRWLEAAVEAAEREAVAAPGAWRMDGLLPPGEASFADLTRMCSPPQDQVEGAKEGAGRGRRPLARIRLRFSAEDVACYRQAVAALRDRYGQGQPEWWCLAVMARHFITEHAEAEAQVKATLARRVIRRDNYTCAACECLQRGGLEADHIWLKGAGGPDAEHNETSLCAAHHRRIKHELGTLVLYGQAPDRLMVRMGRGEDARTYHNDRRIGEEVTEEDLRADPWAVKETPAVYSVV